MAVQVKIDFYELQGRAYFITKKNDMCGNSLYYIVKLSTNIKL